METRGERSLRSSCGREERGIASALMLLYLFLEDNSNSDPKRSDAVSNGS
jgi:hypothetical protein